MLNPSPFPVVPSELLEAIAAASATGRKRGNVLATALINLPHGTQPLVEFFESLRPDLTSLSASARMALIESAVIRAAEVLESAAPELVGQGSWRSPVPNRPIYEPIVDAAKSAGLEMPIDSVVAALALRSDSLALDFSAKGYEGHTVSYEIMHAVALAAYSLDAQHLAAATQYLPTIVANAACRMPASAESLGVIWDVMMEGPSFDPWCLEQIINSPNFDQAVVERRIQQKGAEGSATELAIHSALGLAHFMGSRSKLH